MSKPCQVFDLCLFTKILRIALTFYTYGLVASEIGSEIKKAELLKIHCFQIPVLKY